MRQFIIFLLAVFICLFLAVLNKTGQVSKSNALPTLRIFGYASFTGRMGPGPILKEQFEKSCQCVVEFIEGSDSGILLQRLKIEGEGLGADLVVGLDQFDLAKALEELQWRKLSVSGRDFYGPAQGALKSPFFIPYDWGILTFVMNKAELAHIPASLEDLLLPEYTNKIGLQDPRTSSPGMQFLYWVVQTKGEEEGFKFLEKLFKQVHSISPSWSTSYGLFTNNQTKLVYSYVTSPLYHELEEKNKNYLAIKFPTEHPLQFEFLGIPEYCRNCDLAERFVNLMLSPEAQKVIMEKNYMFPVLKGVLEKTPFEALLDFRVQSEMKVPTVLEIDHLIKRWNEIKRGEFN